MTDDITGCSDDQTFAGVSVDALRSVADKLSRRTPPTPATEEREAVARAIATGLGDDFDHAHAHKFEWNATHGEKGGRFRDINEPMQPDYLDAADTALSALAPARAAEIIAAEARERARIATYLNMRAEQWRDLAVAHSGDALKWADCSARENELLRQAIAIERNEHGAGK